jgi:pimeloyl-ACP methyl ester carboxylesterase
MSAPLSRIVAPQVADHDRAWVGGVAMAPISFGGRFGWLHQPARVFEGAAGVVLVSPLGRDERCVHRPMRLLADRLARAGYPTLRFDHLGQGDSLDLEDDGDVLPEWIGGVRSAAEFLKDVTGVHRVVLGGVRFGASLAALAAPRIDGVDGLMLLAPVVSGKAWLRELRLAGALSGTASDAASQAGGLEADGLALTPATVRALSALDLKAADPADRKVMLVAQNQSIAALGEHLRQHGAAVIEQAFAGYDPLFEDAHSNHAPEEIFAQAVQWIRTISPIDRGAVAGDCPHPPACQLMAAGAVETPVEFGSGLRGVITRPSVRSAARRGVILLNSGGDPRAGIGRFAVLGARTLAAQGVASLRFDFAGIGDSADPQDGRRHIYEIDRTADIQAAVDLMTAEGLANLTLAGVCAGAYHAIQAATADIGVAKVLAISPVKLVWREGDSLAVAKHDQGRATSFYLSCLTKPEIWRRLVRGDIDVASVVKTVTSRMLARLAARRDDMPKAFRDQIAATSARGVEIKILVGVDDASLDEVETYFGPKSAAMDRLAGMSTVIEPGLDHGLARAESRVRAMAELLDLIGRP